MTDRRYEFWISLVCCTTAIDFNFLFTPVVEEFDVINDPQNLPPVFFLVSEKQPGRRKNLNDHFFTARRDLGHVSVFDDVVGEVGCAGRGELYECSEGFVFELVVEVA
ncbi:hypothetical protein CULCOIPH004_04990 [Corynebacterium ulcerans]|nr:hypothetical protein CULCOIPH004_04990 [Corynebacterium ulcerans]